MACAPFGETYASSGSTDPAFTGQRQDTVSGLYDFPAREYSIQGRWPSPDPAGLAAVDPSNPQSWNRYAYVLNDPLAWIDPLGLDPLPCDTLTCIIILGPPGTTGTIGQGGGGGGSGNPPCTVQAVPDPYTELVVAGYGLPEDLMEMAPPPQQTRPCGRGGASNTGGGNSTGAPATNFTLGLRQPGQTFNQCMQANAGNYSLLGVADFALNANGQLANNFWLGFTPASNSIANTYNAATGSLTSLLQAGPTIATAGMGTVVTYGRRTSSIISLNLTGTPGGSKGGYPALGSAPSNAAQASKVAAAFLKLAIDAGFFLAEGAGCLGPMNY